MIGRMVVAIALAISAVASVDSVNGMADPPSLGLTPDSRGVSWQDQPGAATFHVSGFVNYWPPCSSRGDPALSGERVPFDEMLVTHSTRFDWPPPHDERLTVRKDFVFNISALDAASTVLVGDGFAITVEATCAPDELAAAGMDPSPGGQNLTTWLVALIALGSTGLAVGLLLKRRGI